MGLLPSQPNVEFWNTELYGGPKQYEDFPMNGEHTFAMCNLLFNQRSRGSVTLRSADPADNPVVDHNYLSDPLDMLVMTEACVFANEMVMRGRGTQGCVKGSWPAHLTHHTHSTREDWIPHVKEHATTCKSHTLSPPQHAHEKANTRAGYHPSSTCAMGPSSDPNAVLDSHLRVRGVRNLRVADVSSIPRLNNGHTQMVAYGVGEGAAEMIKLDAGADSNSFLKLA